MPVLIDALMHEYGQKLEYVTGRDIGLPAGDGLSLAAALMLYTQISLRHGNEPAGPDYLERELLAARKKARELARERKSPHLPHPSQPASTHS